MSTKTDPGSYTITDEPYDVYGSTHVPLRTPHGPVTLWFTDDSNVMVESGYVTSDHGRGQAYLNTDDEAFTWKGRDVVGSQNFRQHNAGWLLLTNRNFPDQGYGSGPHFSGKGGSITDKMAEDICAYWGEIIRRYVTEHPRIPAHAALRDAVRQLEDQDKAIHEAEQALTVMRQARACIRRDVRRTFAQEWPLRAQGEMNAPRPYAHESLNGFIIELEQDAMKGSKS